MSRILLVYYSRTGTTREVARRLAPLLDADLEEIVDPTPRRGWLGFLRSGFDARRHRLPPIQESEHDPADYDVVVIGTPIWASSIATPVLAYARRHREAIHGTAFFCTCGGTGSKSVFAQLEAEVGRAPVARMVLRQDDLATVSADLLLERFAAEVSAQPTREPEAPPPPRPEESALH